MKVLKVYLKNCPGSFNTKIYCIKHEIGENLENLKEKILLRVPQLRSASIAPVIFWVDLENDNIHIRCDDDLKFFMEESEMRKLTFEYKLPQETSRKRRSLLDIDCIANDDDYDDDGHSECSKRLRRIDLSSSSMDMMASEVEVEGTEGNTASSNGVQDPMPVGQVVDNLPAPAKVVNIISVESIDPQATKEDSLNNNGGNESQVVAVEEVINANDSGNETSNEEQPKEQPCTSSESLNRIIISDSSEEEDNVHAPRQHGSNSSSNNNNHYNSHYSYSFASAGASGAGMGGNENLFHTTRARRVFRDYALLRDNIRAAHDNARENARTLHDIAREHVRRARMNIGNTRNSLQSEMLQNFRAHFQPLFHSNIHGAPYRH